MELYEHDFGYEILKANFKFMKSVGVFGREYKRDYFYQLVKRNTRSWMSEFPEAARRIEGENKMRNALCQAGIYGRRYD